MVQFAQMDFKQHDKVLITEVGGIPIEKGNFLFYVDQDGFRKMVLTDNAGNFITNGYVFNRVPPETWQESSTWTNNNAYYIDNFVGVLKRTC